MRKIKKETFISIKKYPYLYNLIVFQLTLFCVLIGISVIFSNVQTDAKNNFESIYKGVNIFQIMDISDQSSFEDKFRNENIPIIKKLNDELNQKYKIMEGIDQDFEAGYSKTLNDFLSGGISQYGETVEEGQTVSYKSLRINKNYMDYYKFKVTEGRLFDENDFIYEKGDTVPVLLGNEYKNIYQLGAVFSGNYMIFSEETEFEVIGFLDDGLSMFNFGSGTSTSLKNYIIVPSVEINLQNAAFDRMVIANYSQTLCGTIITDLHEDITNDVTNLFDSYGYGDVLKIRNLNNNVTNAYEIYVQVSRMANLILFSIIGFVIIMISMTYLKKFEQNFERYAIHIALGASKLNILSYVISDLIVLLILSNVISISVLFLLDIVIRFSLFSNLFEITQFILLTDIVIICFIALITGQRVRKIKLGEYMRRLQQ